MNPDLPKLRAAIGVRFRDALTFYVKRSEKMANYPGVWSLPSIQFGPQELPDPSVISSAQALMEEMSKERLGGVPIKTNQFLISGDSTDNPFGRHVFLYLYEIELPEEPRLNPDYYTDSAWLTAREYEERSAGQRCGLCLRLWSDYAWMAGLTDRPFLAHAEAYHD